MTEAKKGLFTRSFNVCAFCLVNSAEHRAHIVSSMHDGPDIFWNLIPTCEAHNPSKRETAGKVISDRMSEDSFQYWTYVGARTDLAFKVSLNWLYERTKLTNQTKICDDCAIKWLGRTINHLGAFGQMATAASLLETSSAIAKGKTDLEIKTKRFARNLSFDQGKISSKFGTEFSKTKGNLVLVRDELLSRRLLCPGLSRRERNNLTSALADICEQDVLLDDDQMSHRIKADYEVRRIASEVVHGLTMANGNKKVEVLDIACHELSEHQYHRDAGAAACQRLAVLFDRMLNETSKLLDVNLCEDIEFHIDQLTSRGVLSPPRYMQVASKYVPAMNISNFGHAFAKLPAASVYYRNGYDFKSDMSEIQTVCKMIKKELHMCLTKKRFRKCRQCG